MLIPRSQSDCVFTMVMSPFRHPFNLRVGEWGGGGSRGVLHCVALTTACWLN